MPRSTLSLVMLTAALWMLLNPVWWLEIWDGLQEGLNRLPMGRPRMERPPIRLSEDRRTRMAVQLMGGLLALVAAMNLYQQAVKMLQQ